jgi:ferrous iron transport protein A
MIENVPPAGWPTGSASLAAAAIGSTARVADVAGDDAVAIRLLEMGVTPGVTVRVIGQAPFGDPLELELRGYRLSIRRAEAARVMLVVP